MSRPRRFILTEPAARDLQEIRLYLIARSPETSHRVRDALLAACRNLAKNPELGHARPDLMDPALRVFVVFSWFLVYDPRTSPLQIIRVLHAARDIPALLD